MADQCVVPANCGIIYKHIMHWFCLKLQWAALDSRGAVKKALAMPSTPSTGESASRIVHDGGAGQ